jgi:hypothetical protein
VAAVAAVAAVPSGSRLHGVGEEGVPFQDIAAASGCHLQVPVVSMAGEDASDYLDFPSTCVPLDNPTSSALTQPRLAWQL